MKERKTYCFGCFLLCFSTIVALKIPSDLNWARKLFLGLAVNSSGVCNHSLFFFYFYLLFLAQLTFCQQLLIWTQGKHLHDLIFAITISRSQVSG